jgi:hypothetical protein
MTVNGAELALQGDVLINVLAFKGQSGQLMASALDQVGRLTASGSALYPPVHFSDFDHWQVESSLLTAPNSEFDGRLSPAEGVAFLILLNECGAIAPNLFSNVEKSKMIQKMFGLGRDGWISDALDGFARLGSQLSRAAGIRDRLLAGEGEPVGGKMREVVRQNHWRVFAKAIVEDSFILGEKTVEAAVGEAARLAERDIQDNPGGARTPGEIRARINSFRKGAMAGGRLYLEARKLAARLVEEKIEPKSIDGI